MAQRAENDLLLCIARRELTARDETKRDRLLAGPLDWTYLHSVAHEHGLIPLMHRHLGDCNVEALRPQLTILRREAIENCQSVLHLLGRLAKLLKVFDEELIPALLFKGTTLSTMAYGGNSLRQAGDLDILIPPDHFYRAKKVLESLGYRMVPELTDPQLRAHLKFHCEATFVTDDGFTVVDLHWSLSPKAFTFKLNTNDVIARGQTIRLGRVSVRTFATEDLILFQCLHGAKHYWSRLEWIVALSEVIRDQPQIDWQSLAGRAKAARATRILAWGLRLATRVGEVTIPDSVFNEIDRDGLMLTLVDETLANLFVTRKREFRSLNAMQMNLQIMDRKRDVIACLLRVIFVPTLSDWENLTLPPALQPLYFVFRPVRLLKNYAVLLARRIFTAGEIQTASVQTNTPGA